MKFRYPSSALLARALLCAGFGTLASVAVASRVETAAAPAASAVLDSAQPSTASQSDDSASLRQGVVTALAPKGDRLQVQGIWCDVGADQTLVLRGGQRVPLESVRAGETIKFTVAPGAAERPTIRVIYAP